MEQLVNNLLGSWGVPASVVFMLGIIWLQIKPLVFRLLKKRIAQIDNAEWRAIAAGLVRAAEQMFSVPAGTTTPATINAKKRNYVSNALKAAGVPAVGSDLDALIESAVFEVKAPLKAVAKAAPAAE